jgi:hypothetical protein
MEISPIPGIRSLPVMKTPPAEADLSRVFDVENSSRPDDDSYSGSNKKGAGGQDDEDNVTEESALASESNTPQPAEDSSELPNTAPAVNYFA